MPKSLQSALRWASGIPLTPGANFTRPEEEAALLGT